MKLKLILLIVISLLPASAQGMRWQALEEEVAADKSIDLDIFVDGLTISQDERYVVAWGNTPYLLENNSGLSKLNGGARNVRVIDLQQRRVISKGIFPSSPTSVLAIGDSIFVSLLGSRNRFDLINADPPLDGGEMEEALRDLYVYDRDTMKSLPKIRLPQPPKDLYTLPAQQLGVRCYGSGQTTFTICETRQGKQQIVDNQIIHAQTTPFARRNRTQIEYQGAIYDLDSNRVVSLASKPGYDPIVTKAATGPNVRYISGSRKPITEYPVQARDWENPFCFGRQMVGGKVYNEKRNYLFSTRAAVQNPGARIALDFISPTDPVCYTALIENDSTKNIESCYLYTFQLLDGQMVKEPVVMFSQSSKKRRGPFSKIAAAASSSKIVVANRGTIFDYQLENLNLTNDQHLLSLSWPDKQIISADQIEQFKVPHQGGRGEIKFHLLNPIDGVEIDTDTGELTVDAPKLWQDFVDYSLKTGRPDLEVINSIEADGQPRGLFQKGAVTPSQIFENLYGYPCGFDKEPTSLKLEVLASDSYGQIANLRFYVTVLGRVETLETARKNARLKTAQLENNGEENAAGVQPPKPIQLDPAERVKQLRKLHAMEHRLTALENKARELIKKTQLLNANEKAN